MSFAVGSLVRARGREWVVLPESKEDLLVLRPLGSKELNPPHCQMWVSEVRKGGGRQRAERLRP